MSHDIPQRLFRVLNRFFMVPMFRLGLGPFMGNPLSGYIMVIRTVGRKSGKIRYAPVNYVIHKGDIWDAGQAMVALYSWIGSHGYASAGSYRELHLFWRELEIETEHFSNIVIEMQIPIVPL